MSTAEQPTWSWIKQKALKPTVLDQRIRVGIAISIGFISWFATGNLHAFAISGFFFIIIPYAVVSIVDVYLRLQFSLLTLLIAISTLQIPMLAFFRIESNFGIGLGIALLLTWLVVVGWKIKKQLDKQTPRSLPNEVKTE